MRDRISSELSLVLWPIWQQHTANKAAKIMLYISSFSLDHDVTYHDVIYCLPWWRHQMEAFSALLAICAGNSPVPGEFPAQRPVTRSFDVFFDLHPNRRLSKQWRGWWFETLSCPLWRHRIFIQWGGGVIYQTIFSIFFLVLILFNLIWFSMMICFQCFYQQLTSIGPENSSVPFWRQTSIWANHQLDTVDGE